MDKETKFGIIPLLGTVIVIIIFEGSLGYGAVFLGFLTFIVLLFISYGIEQLKLPEEAKYLGQGERFAQKKDYDEAIYWFNKVLKVKPDHNKAQMNKFKALHHKSLNLKSIKNYEESINYLNEALKIKPDSVVILNDKAQCLFKINRYEDAMKSIDKALEINSKSEDSWLIKGHIYAKIGEYENAIGIFEKILKINPNNKEILNDPFWIFATKEMKILKEREKEELELSKKENQIRSSNLFYLIENFVLKYQDNNPDKLSTLKKLLESKDIIITEGQLEDLVQKEIDKKNYINFKKKLTYNNPQDLREYVKNLLDLYGEHYYKHMDSFMQLLKEQSISTNDEETSLLLHEIKDEIELKHFEEELKTPEEFIGLKDIDNLTGFEFEEYLKLLFKKMGYKAKNTSLSHDQGADLIIERFGETIVVQAKRYTDKVGNKAVQEVVASIAHYQAQRGIVVTNNEFTDSAIKLAETNNVRLIDRYQLDNLINKYPILKSNLIYNIVGKS